MYDIHENTQTSKILQYLWKESFLISNLRAWFQHRVAFEYRK